MYTFYLIVVLSSAQSPAGITNSLLRFKAVKECLVVRKEYLKIKAKPTYRKHSYVSECLYYDYEQ